MSYPHIWAWYCRVKDHCPYWNEVNRDFYTFHQFGMAISRSEGIPTVHHTICFQKGPESVYSQLKNFIKQDQFDKTEKEGDVPPERIIIQNFKADYIPKDHYIVLEIQVRTLVHFSSENLQLTGNSKQSKLNFSLINVPPTKLKAISETWLKVWKQMNGHAVTDISTLGLTRLLLLSFSAIYLHKPHSQVWDVLLNGENLSILTRTRCSISPTVNSDFSLLDNSITGRNIDVHKNNLIIQQWKLHDWRSHFSTLKYQIKPMVLGEMNGCCIQLSHLNIPQDKLKDVEQKHHSLWKKIRAEEVETMQQEVHFQGASLEDFFSRFNGAIGSASGFKLKKRADIKESDTSIIIKQEYYKYRRLPLSLLTQVQFRLASIPCKSSNHLLHAIW